jgi:hypothetical protein
MAKTDFLDDISEAIEDANLKTTAEKKDKANVTSVGLKTKVKNIKMPIEWDKIIKERTGNPSSGYIMSAIKDKMVQDGFI